MPEAHVTIYDVETKVFTSIPQSELAPGMVRVQMEGHDGIVWMDSKQLKEGGYKHPPFAGERRDSVLALAVAFPDVYERTYEFWEDGFRRDANPDREIGIWMHIIDIYNRHAADRTLESRGELFSLVVACSSADPESIDSVFKRSLISESDFQRIVADYYST